MTRVWAISTLVIIVLWGVLVGLIANNFVAAVLISAAGGAAISFTSISLANRHRPPF